MSDSLLRWADPLDSNSKASNFQVAQGRLNTSRMIICRKSLQLDIVTREAFITTKPSYFNDSQKMEFKQMNKV